MKTQRILLQNFGPIKRVELEVKDYLVFIGPQAAGKSTISKAIYFFKSLKNDLVRFITERVNHDADLRESPVTGYKKKIRSKFVSFWGTTKHLKSLDIQYNYGNSKKAWLYLDDGYVNTDFSQAFYNELNNLFKQMLDYMKGKRGPDDIFSNPDPSAMSRQMNFFKRIQLSVDKLFEDSRAPMYIPAGRSLLSTLSEQLQQNLIGGISSHSGKETDDIDPYLLDLPLKNFIERISRQKLAYSQDLEDIIEDREKFTSGKIDFESVYKAKEIIEKILKGKYINDHLGERLLLPDSEDYVKLSLASSGQQEAVWILLQIFPVILSGYQVFLVIEEPEAHLYPEAQKDIVALISLFSNINNNQVLLTTHSPYILSSVNNLIYARQVGRTKPEQVEKLIDRSIWLSPEKMGAYFVDNGKTEDIIDDELSLIKAEAIDNASRIINEEFNYLFDLED